MRTRALLYSAAIKETQETRARTRAFLYSAAIKETQLVLIGAFIRAKSLNGRWNVYRNNCIDVQRTH